MMNTESKNDIVGRAEMLDFPELGFLEVPARIDTGARTSAIWASKAELEDGKLAVVFFGEGSPFFDGKAHYFNDFEETVVASSNGQVEERFKVKMLVQLAGKKIRAKFTLADRGTQVYPVLVGRNVLRGKFIVDVKKGTTLRDAERQRSTELKTKLRGNKDPRE